MHHLIGIPHAKPGIRIEFTTSQPAFILSKFSRRLRLIASSIWPSNTTLSLLLLSPLQLVILLLASVAQPFRHGGGLVEGSGRFLERPCPASALAADGLRQEIDLEAEDFVVKLSHASF
ncbi:unnamed protein product [Mesocestoides corti]|uniref:Uncharacterized protein n=1 Tax=Mesocestoides corti TaxID=53468 RepID=A0A0R3UB17_MESCO|nr:unnamed protein product [Mesocestoides corti]